MDNPIASRILIGLKDSSGIIGIILSKLPRKTRNRLNFLIGKLRWLILRVLLGFVVISVLLVLMFRWIPPPASCLMVQRTLQDLWSGEGLNEIHYHWVPFEDMAPHLALAVVAAEDQKFPDHWGFDFGSITQALEEYRQGGRMRGASTISQQVVKNLFLWPGRSFLRKGLEAWLTMLVEALWPKQRILELYLNIAELGDHVFGVEAASQRFFNKPASRLSREEAALLAAVLPNPLRYQVEAPSAHVRQRQRWILGQMNQLGGHRYLENL